ncbi:hypothetical protein PTTG_29116 [Puccinia triticina 1-1 BBBD Race 1]|uniref:Uncharacterized protein n=1 Tax=Puccinia triticina (isolate 1-1 / race 1 (BBBD)) TaxID=630390 RepID=A0A180G6C3_PUCT1|nr:hypothetical protein PTTG_29116 [Puccinia triticina 1-1 BBBD Race 1]
MSGLNIHDATNSVKAASQQTAPEAGEGGQMAQQPNPQTQEPDADTSQPAVLLQASGPNPKPPKAAKPAKVSKPTTWAAAKSTATTPRADPPPEGTPAAQLRDPEIAEIIGPISIPLEPTANRDEPVTVADDEDSAKETDRETQAFLMAQIVKAEKTGDDKKIDRYMKMYESVIADQKSASQRTLTRNDHPVTFKPSTIPQKRPTPPGESTQVRNVKFISGRSNSHDNGGFPPYFHKLLLECKGPLPLTIFNREWQEKALAKHSKNRPKVEETASKKGLRYHGFPVPDKFLQNFSDWTLNHRVFHLTMRDRYHYPVLAEWILAHKEHCDRLHRKRGFMVALRYNIRIRNNAFAFRVEENGEESFSDISQFKQETADEAISTC